MRSGPELAEQYLDGGNKNYISGSGITEIDVADRGSAITFTGRAADGTEVASTSYLGSILVVNFWCASCGPCREKAADLVALSTRYPDAGASFLGVNTYDQGATALAVERERNSVGGVAVADDGAVEEPAAPAPDLPATAACRCRYGGRETGVRSTVGASRRTATP